ncbi:MAG: hypothetical protein ACTSPY_10580 [Candidatus Helarchaeota archaeon]
MINNNKKAFFLILIFFNVLISTNLIKQNINNTWKYTKDIEGIPLSSASWTLNGVVISNAMLSQKTADVCSDESGGIIITWIDYRTSLNQIYAQRINATGHVLWTTNGIQVAPISYDQDTPQICSDGLGGAIIVWADYRTPGTTPSIYAQRIDASGMKLWGSSGIIIYHDSTDWQKTPKIISDGANGAIIIWLHNNGGNYYIYGQRVNATGQLQWGILKSIYISGNADEIQMCGDGSGGAYITWAYGDIYAQRINSAGNRYWVASGISICSSSGTQAKPQIIKDGTDNAVIVWHDTRAGANYDIYAQRIDGAGTVQWTANGIGICTASNNQQNPQICSDGGNGSIITWQDVRKSDWDIYAQRINASGQVYWDSNGIPISNTGINQQYPSICDDGVGGAIISWHQGDIYAQRINETGDAQWVANGSAICNASGTQRYPITCSDGTEGAYIVWEDFRSDNWGDLYVYRTIMPSNPTLQPITPSVDTDGIIDLNWTECFGAGYYYIYRETSVINSVDGLTPIATTSSTTYSDTIPANGEYYYVIVAGNPIGNSSISNCENVTASVLPNSPTLNEIIPKIDPDGYISLNWSDEIAITTYYVYRDTSFISNITGLNPIATVVDSNYTDYIQINGIYYYVIVSKNDLGNSSISNCENVTVAIPPSVSILDPIIPTIDADGIINLNWSNVVNATLYHIYRNTSFITTVVGLNPIDTVSNNYYTDTITTNGLYFYVIVADNGWANSSISNCENVTVAIPPGIPILDPIIPTIDSDGIITLNWSNVVNVTQYYIYRNTSVITTVIGLTPIDTVSNNYYTDTITTNGLYFYVIVANNGWANSTISNCENVTVAIPPSAPTLDPITPAVNTDGNITLNWNNVSNATLYYIYRNTSFIITIVGLNPIAIITNTNYTDVITTIGIYYYVIVADNGWANSSISNCQNVTIAIAPILNSIIPEINTIGIISLNWTNVDGATRYYIYRANLPIDSVENLTAIAVINSTNYQDIIVVSGTYYYVIVAGNDQVNSTSSNNSSAIVTLRNNNNFFLLSILMITLIPSIGICVAVIIIYYYRKPK